VIQFPDLHCLTLLQESSGAVDFVLDLASWFQLSSPADSRAGREVNPKLMDEVGLGLLAHAMLSSLTGFAAILRDRLMSPPHNHSFESLLSAVKVEGCKLGLDSAETMTSLLQALPPSHEASPKELHELHQASGICVYRACVFGFSEPLEAEYRELHLQSPYLSRPSAW